MVFVQAQCTDSGFVNYLEEEIIAIENRARDAILAGEMREFYGREGVPVGGKQPTAADLGI